MHMWGPRLQDQKLARRLYEEKELAINDELHRLKLYVVYSVVVEIINDVSGTADTKSRTVEVGSNHFTVFIAYGKKKGFLFAWRRFDQNEQRSLGSITRELNELFDSE